GYAYTSPTGINAWGQIVGWCSDGSTGHGFLPDQGSYTTLDVPGSNGTQANGINAAGQVVGWYRDAAGNIHAFLLDQGSYTTVDVPGSTRTVASGINDSGVTGRPLWRNQVVV